MVPRAWCSMRPAARCRNSCARAGTRACCWRSAARTTKRMSRLLSRPTPRCRCGWSDFAAQRINWETKGANLASLADELDLGLDSVILMDDNPKEVTEAQAGAPQALAVALPDARRGDPRISAPRVGLRPRPSHRGGPPARGTLRPARRARPRAAQLAPAWRSFWRRWN